MKHRIVFSLFCFLFVGCSSPKPVDVTGFPLEEETTWVYSYEVYESSLTDPMQIVKATYQLTDTIVKSEITSNYVVAHVKRERELVKADTGWMQGVSVGPNEFWYVSNDHQLFQSNSPLDMNNIKLEDLILDYEFPLSLGKSWCLFSGNSSDPQGIADCDFVGKREVTDQGRYETQAGNFDHCYDLIDYYNGGNIFHTFCDGIGIVFMKFDHSGTRFGFEQTLILYSSGSP